MHSLSASAQWACLLAIAAILSPALSQSVAPAPEAEDLPVLSTNTQCRIIPYTTYCALPLYLVSINIYCTEYIRVVGVCLFFCLLKRSCLTTPHHTPNNKHNNRMDIASNSLMHFLEAAIYALNATQLPEYAMLILLGFREISKATTNARLG
jgi:hypothetical protein